jgi:hypothetical protein
MSRMDPGPGCLDFAFAHSYALSDAAEGALEDYARALAGARAAETTAGDSADGPVSGVHLCGAAPGAAPVLQGELEAFARELAARSGRTGLGWE